MISWLLALAAGCGAAVWHYGWPLPHDPYRRALLALRVVAVLLAVALLLDAPLGARRTRALVALDVSASWAQGGGTTGRFAEAAQRARSSDGELMLLSRISFL